MEINSRDYLNGKKAAWNMEKKIRRKYAWIKWKPQKAAKIRAFAQSHAYPLSEGAEDPPVFP